AGAATLRARFLFWRPRPMAHDREQRSQPGLVAAQAILPLRRRGFPARRTRMERPQPLLRSILLPPRREGSEGAGAQDSSCERPALIRLIFDPPAATRSWKPRTCRR